MFFSTYIGHLGGRKNDTYKIRGNISFSNLSNFVLRPFQRKNPCEKNDFFGALRATIRKEEEEKRKEKNFDSRIVGAKATLGCFSQFLNEKQGARSARNFWGLFFASEASTLQKTQKALAETTLSRPKSARKYYTFTKKKH